jgi:Fe-S oxidoreductase
MLPGAETDALAGIALTFEEFLSREQDSGKLKLNLSPLNVDRAIVHGHCHQKAFAVMDEVKTALLLVPDLEVEIIDSGCCGMAGAFGYEAGNYDISMTMGEIGLFPAVRGASSDTLIVASGTSCRHQIRDGAGREAVHVARVLEKALGNK